MRDVITQAAFGREIGVTRQRVWQMVQAGLPVRADKKLNRIEALRWTASHRFSWRGGWAVRKIRPGKTAPLPPEDAEWLDAEWDRISRAD